MRGHYFNLESDEAYEKGKRDGYDDRRSYDYDKYSMKERDEAYYDGHKDGERRREAQEEERRAEEEHEQMMERRRQEQQEEEDRCRSGQEEGE